MQIKVLRYDGNDEVTLGLFFVDGKFQVHTLEDAVRKEKVKGKTCIPEGTYEIQLRTWGAMHHRYLEKYGDKFHKGMLEIMGVQGFSDILIHIGNSNKDTAGCLLVGSSANPPAKNFTGASATAYKKIYPKIAKALLAKQLVTLEITSQI